jgi:hypothetical protein
MAQGITVRSFIRMFRLLADRRPFTAVAEHGWRLSGPAIALASGRLRLGRAQCSLRSENLTSAGTSAGDSDEGQRDVVVAASLDRCLP